MNIDKIEKKCGFVGMAFVLGSLAIGFMVSFVALISLLVCICKCL